MGIDLHVHSIYSDGALSPEEIINAAVETGLSAISITDHDNVLAYRHAKACAKQLAEEKGLPEIQIVPGIEVNTILDKAEVHVLGYFFDESNQELLDMIKFQQHARIEQITKIVENLNTMAKIKITMEDITSLVHPGGSVGRPHMAKAIVNVGGVSNTIEAYKRFINDDAAVYIQRHTVSPHDAVEIIYEAGGIPVLAHPHSIIEPEKLIKDLMNYGLRGVETYHRRHSPAVIEYLSTIAENYGLVKTGGSDCHGVKVGLNYHLGRTHVPDWVITELKEEKNRLEIASGRL